MDTQPSANLANPGEQPSGGPPEVLPVGPAASEQAQPAPEAAPQPAADPNAGQPPASSGPPALSSDDVAAAMAAVPASQPAADPAPPIPGTAADVDVIEPEWVDKAEHVIEQHEGDPYGEEEAEEELQEEYLKKRYNYDVANPNPDTHSSEDA